MSYISEILQLAEQHHRRLMRHRERYVKAWLAETGLLPSECEIVEERFTTATGFTTRVTVRRRSAT